MRATLVTDPGELGGLFEQDRETHLYGLADLEEPFWSSSAWFRTGEAAVGKVTTGGDWVAGYAMSQENPGVTLELLLEMQDVFPAGTWVTGPLGLDDTLSSARATNAKGVHQRMILREPPDGRCDPAITRLGSGELDAVVELHSSDPDESFFMPSMLSGGVFVGLWDGTTLVASAGTHVTSERHGIAAVGSVITRPSHRGVGFGRRVVTALCQRLAGRYRTIGLNVAKSNNPAIRIYQQVGFRRVFDYEEVQLL